MGCGVGCVNDMWNNVSNERLQWKDSATGNNKHVIGTQSRENQLIDNLSQLANRLIM